jgi:hypothetical protein
MIPEHRYLEAEKPIEHSKIPFALISRLVEKKRDLGMLNNGWLLKTAHLRQCL